MHYIVHYLNLHSKLKLKCWINLLFGSYFLVLLLLISSWSSSLSVWTCLLTLSAVARSCRKRKKCYITVTTYANYTISLQYNNYTIPFYFYIILSPCIRFFRSSCSFYTSWKCRVSASKALSFLSVSLAPLTASSLDTRSSSSSLIRSFIWACSVDRQTSNILYERMYNCNFCCKPT